MRGRWAAKATDLRLCETDLVIRRLHSSKSLSCGANSAWQQLSVLAHNQLDAGAEPKRRSRKRTYAFLFRSMRTLRFLVIARAGRVVRIGGRTRLRLAQNPGVQQLYERLDGSASL